MTSANPTNLSGLARALVQQGRLSEADAMRIAANAKPGGGSFVGELIAAGRLTAREVATFAAETFGYPLLDLDAFNEEHINKDAIDRRVMVNHQVLAMVRRGNRLAVALADPTNVRALAAPGEPLLVLGADLVVEADKLSALIAKLVERPETTLEDLAEDDLSIEFDEEPVVDQGSDSTSAEVDDAPVVKFIQKILHDAIAEGASDVHFEPYEKYYRIRFRVDGVLREVAQPPLVIKEKVASRIKVISRLNIAEKRLPQDGRMKLVLSKSRTIDFRVSTLPTLHGEKIVLRILDPASATYGIEALGYEPDQKDALMAAIGRPYGMVLVTGPTGSGKTVSLYTCLNILNRPGTNISTAEDPAEINMAGVNQVNVDDRAGLTFATALRAFLRQDPDIFMVGEIRDLETAEISVKAAQTGHLVLSTLHTNDAPQTLTRLMNMGVPTYNVASSIILIMAQRLARRLCTCKVPITVPVETLLNAGFTEDDLDGSWQLFGPGGCERCKGSGYKGRVGIYQVMPVSEEIQRIIMASGSALEIAAQAQAEGVRDLRRSGLLKVKQGVTSLDEVLATTNE